MATRHSGAVLAVLIVIITILTSGCAVSSDDGSLDRVRAAGKIVVGVDPSYPPFAFLDDQGSPTGYEIELAGTLADRIAVAPDFVGIDVGSIIDALIARKVDLVVSGLSPDASYGKRVTFLRPYFNNGQVVVARGESMTTLASLAGRYVAVESGSNADLELRERLPQFPDLHIRPFTTLELALDALQRDSVDAAVTDAASAAGFVSRNPGLFAGSPFTSEYYAAVLRSGDISLMEAMNGALEALDREGHLAALQAKWLR